VTPSASKALRSRPRRGDDVTTELKRSYSAAQLLACAAPTGASIEFMSTKATVVLRGVFQAFEANSVACVEHACRVLTHIADEVGKCTRHLWSVVCLSKLSMFLFR
jgi:hypothetical protein